MSEQEDRWNRRWKRPRNGENSRQSTGGSSTSSSDEPAPELPGFVYDPVRKRYFRVSTSSPDNNFTVPINQVVAVPRRLRKNWLHPIVQQGLSQAQLLTRFQLPSSGVFCGRIRENAAAYRHDYLADLQYAPGVNRWTQVNQGAGVHCSFHAVDALLDGTSPRVFYVSRPSRSQGSNRSKTGLEFRSANFCWNHDKLIPTEFRTLRAGSILPTEFCEVNAVSLFPFPPSCLAFLTCSSSGNNTGYRVGLYVNETTSGIHFVNVTTPHNISVASRRDPLVATASDDSPLIRCFSLDNLSYTSLTLDDHAGHDEVFSSCLDFVATNRSCLLVGTTRGKVIQVDVRDRTFHQLLSSSIWRSLGMSGKCRISSLKTLNNRNCFISTVAGLPLESPKMHLWDCRKLTSPLSNFEETAFPFHRDRLQIGVSLDDSLIVCSDVEGTCRLWDIDSACLLGRIPVPNYDEESQSNDWISPVAFYSDRCCGTPGQRALIMAYRGLDPRLLVYSL